MPASGEHNGHPAMVRPQDCDGRFTSSGSRSVPRFLRRTDSASKAPRAPDSSPTCPSPPGRGCRSVMGDIPAVRLVRMSPFASDAQAVGHSLVPGFGFVLWSQALFTLSQL